MGRLGPGLALFLCVTSGCGADELPEVLVVRDFTLTDQRGERFASGDLEGHVWVASFVFTSCADVCPLITNQVANLHRRVPDARVRFLSITVDPEVDTPERLAEYAERYRADDRWTFLTGTRAEIHPVVTQIFRVAMGERNDGAEGYSIPHSEQLLLVDQRMTLRGVYETDRAGMDRLTTDIGRLLGD